MSVKKSVRFEVFKRDKFTCQYCGRSAPDVILEADHIHPRSEGGADDLLNLVTSCRDCNSGKSNRLLSDDAAVKQRKRQLDELEERREQLEMMMEWQRSLVDLDGQAVQGLSELWSSLVVGWSLTDHGIGNLRRWLAKFSYVEIAEAMRISVAQYVALDSNTHKPLQASVDKAFTYVPKICAVRRNEQEKPYLHELLYINGILRNRLSYVGKGAIHLMDRAVQVGISVDDIRQLSKTISNWSSFEATLEDWIQNAGD